jgi:hypothetical protein
MAENNWSGAETSLGIGNTLIVLYPRVMEYQFLICLLNG